MNKPLTLILTLFLLSSTYADERMSKNNLLKQWDGRVVTMNGQEDTLVSFEVVNGEILHITNEDSHNTESKNTDIWIRDNGKLCIEYSRNDDCQRVIKTFDGVFTFKSDFSLEKRILTLSDNIEEVIAARALKNNKPHIRAVDNLEYRDGVAYAIGENKSFSGIYATKHSNGKNKLKVNYINGLKDETSHSWYYSGKLKKTTNYVKGKKIGLDQYYYPDGSKWDSAFYDKNGDLLFEETVETGPNSKWITQNFYEDKKRFKRRVLSSKRWKKKVIFYNLGKNADRAKVIKIDRYPTKELVKRKGLEYMVDYESDIPYTGRYVKLKDKSLALKSIKKPCETDPNIEEGIEYEFGVRDGNAFSCNEDGSSINYKYVFGKKYSEEEYKNLGSQLIYNKNLKQFHEYNNFYKKKETAVEENILKEKENGIASSLRVVNNIAYIPNDSEPFTGKYIRKYSNGKKEIESTYKIGKQEGKETWYYKTGKKGRESNYKDGQLDGLETEWYKGGQKQYETTWMNGVKQKQIRWNKHRVKQMETNFREGEKHGLETTWYGPGQIKRETNYKDGNEHGLEAKWYMSGQKSSETAYENGKDIKNSTFKESKRTVETKEIKFTSGIAYVKAEEKPYTGIVIEYHLNGEKFLEYEYKKGIQEGLEIQWREDGTKEGVMNYVNGEKHGLFTMWHPNGQKRSEVNYINGTRQEKDHFEGLKRLKDPWSKDIVTIAKKTRKISETNAVNKLEYRNGIAYAVGENKGFSGTYITKHSNGKNKLKINFINGFKDGPSTSWHYNGQKKSLVYYKKNKKEGFETRWHYEGQKAEETNYAHGIKNGLSTEWYENGKKYRETNFVNGKGNRTQWNKLGKKRWAGYVDSGGRIIEIGKKNRSKSSKKSTGVTSLFIGPDSMKTTVYRDGDVAEQTETIFVDRNHRVKGEKELREKWRAKWKAAWKEGRTIDDLKKEEFILNPDLERRFSKYRDDAIGLFYSDNKKDKEEAVVILRKLAFAGSSPAYYDLIFRSPDNSYEEDNKLQFYKLFGNMFEYSFSKRDKTKVSNEIMILAKDNPNNNADQNELIRSLLLLSQKKFQHYNHLINIAGADMFLSYMILSMPGSQSDAKTEYFLAARFDRNEIGEITDYLLTNEEIVKNVEKEAEEGDVLSMMFLVNMHNPKDMYKTLKQIVPQNAEKAIYYSKKIIEHIKAHKDDVDIKKSPSLARKAYETLRELKDESMLKEVNIYFKDIDEAKANKQREIRKQGQFCTVSFMEGDKPKRKTYTYYKTENCLAHIKHADENGYLDKGRFKNGNNPLIFWGPQGTYEGTQNLMKNHKPLTTRTAEEKFKIALDIWREHRDVEATEWFEEAANEGHGEAARFMSEIYEGIFKNHKKIEPDIKKAIYWYQKAIDNGSKAASNELAWLLSTGKDNKLRGGKRAIRTLEEYFEKNEKRAHEVDTLAAAYAETGDFEEAVKFQKEAISLLEDQKELESYKNVLKKYMSKTNEDYSKWEPEKQAAKAVVDSANKTWSKDELMAQGESVYNTNCAGCHKKDGSGMPPVFPAMIDSPIANGAAADHIGLVLHGKGAMPTFKMLGDADLAAVITYERNAFGNTGSVVQPSDVKSAR